MKLKVVIEKTDTGFSAYSEEVSGIFTAADSFQELKENIKEVLTFQVDYLKEIGKTKEALALEEAEVAFAIDLKQLFGFYSMLNKSKFAEYIGINPDLLRQYTSKRHVYISDKRLLKIQEGFHRLGKELERVQLT